MLTFPENFYLLEYTGGAYLCNGKVRVEAPLTLETLKQAVQCPSLQGIFLDSSDLTDECFSVLAGVPKLKELSLLGGKRITGHGLSLLKDTRLEWLFLQRTALDDQGLYEAAQLPKLKHIEIAACPHVTFAGLMAISWRDGLWISDSDATNPERLFRPEQRKQYEDARAYKVIQNSLPLDHPSAQDAGIALREFFSGMNAWEQLAESKNFRWQAVQSVIDDLFARHVCMKLRPGWRPLDLHCRHGGTYTGFKIVKADQVTKNKLWLYAEEDIFYYRFLMQKKNSVWMIANSQQAHQGKWKFCGL